MSQNRRGNKVQIKSRERVRDLAEVLTNEREVKAMLDLVDQADQARTVKKTVGKGKTARKLALSAEISSTILEPACGNGNFLAEILVRKLETVKTMYGRNGTAHPKRGVARFDYEAARRFEFHTIRALSSIYGIDIDPENIQETRVRLKAIVSEHMDKVLNRGIPSISRSDGFFAAVTRVLEANILLGDSLKDQAVLTLLEYCYPVEFKYQVTTWTLQQIAERGSAPPPPARTSRVTSYLEVPAWR